MQLKDFLNPDSWTGLAMTNHALARATLETGTRVITTYPGSPTPEIATALTEVPEGERTYCFEYSGSEEVAPEVLSSTWPDRFPAARPRRPALETLRGIRQMLRPGGTVVYRDTRIQPVDVRMGIAPYPEIRELEVTVAELGGTLERIPPEGGFRG